MQTDFELPQNEIGEDSPSDPVSNADQAEATPKDVDGVPYCSTHHCRMKRKSGGRRGSETTYYGCPVPKCKENAQMIRTKRESVVPPNPVSCPRCSTEKKPVICERDEALSKSAFVILKCPSCNWRSNALAVPSLAAQHERTRKRVKPEEIGAR